MCLLIGINQLQNAPVAIAQTIHEQIDHVIIHTTVLFVAMSLGSIQVNSTSRRLRALQLTDLHIGDDMNFNCATCKHWGSDSNSLSGVCYAVKGVIQDGKEYWPFTNAMETCGRWSEKPPEAA